MVGSRTLTALVGLVVGLAVSAAAWIYFDTLALFVFLPFVPFLFAPRSRTSGARGVEESGSPVRRCRTCGFETRNPEFEYCPRDGGRLVEAER